MPKRKKIKKIFKLTAKAVDKSFEVAMGVTFYSVMIGCIYYTAFFRRRDDAETKY